MSDINNNSNNDAGLQDINSHLQECLQQILTDLQLDDAPAGGALVVYQAGKCIARGSVGMAQAEVSWQPDTLSLNFSTGKGVLATLVHVLVTQQLLDYDVPIASYWPEFAANNKADITLRAVMSHQANLFAITSIDADSEALLDWEAMLAKVAAMPITAPDDAVAYVSAYSALVYGWILGGLIEVVTDMSLAAALRYYLTEPLGIADSCYFGVPDEKVDNVAKLAKNFKASEQDSLQPRSKRNKPVLKADSEQTLEAYTKLPSYDCWQQQAISQDLLLEGTKLKGNDLKGDKLSATQINRLYFNHSQLNLKNYKAALMPVSKQPIDYYDKQTLQAVLPAVNGVASAQALATIYAMLANGGEWQGKTLINQATFQQLSTPQVSGRDAVMPTNMEWRLGYHRLVQLCQDEPQSNNAQGIDAQSIDAQGFGHMGYNGSVAWCDPARQLSFAFVHNFDVTMLNDIRQFALTEALLSMIDAEFLGE